MVLRVDAQDSSERTGIRFSVVQSEGNASNDPPRGELRRSPNDESW